MNFFEKRNVKSLELSSLLRLRVFALKNKKPFIYLILALFLTSLMLVWIVSVLAAQVTIDSTAHTTGNSHNGTSPTSVFTSDLIGYAFYRDSGGDCVYSKTADGGGTWGAAVSVDSQTDCIRVAVWYDQWTPGDIGTKIHISTIDNGSDDVFYTELNTTGDILTTTVNATGANQGGTFTAGANLHSISKGTDGTLYMGIQDADDSFVIECSASCDSAVNWSESGTNPFDSANDYLVLVPLSGGDMIAVRTDISANDIQSKVYSAGVWDVAWTNIDTAAQENSTYDGGLAATVDTFTGDIYLSYVANTGTLGTNDDVRTAVYSGGSWTSKTDVITNDSKGVTGTKIAFDKNTADVYVLYSARTTPGTSSTGNVYYKKSTDGMTAWGAEQGPINTSSGNIKGARVNSMSDERIYSTWYEQAADDILGNTIANLTPPTFTQSAYRFFNNSDSTDVGAALAVQDTSATLATDGDAFRLRQLIHLGGDGMRTNLQQFKLQFATRSGTCDTGFSGESYADVTGATAIAFNNNATPADGDNLTANGSDPIHGGDAIVNQDYEELNNFTNTVAAISGGQDGKWDFSLIDNTAPANTSYCFRMVKSDGTVLDTYSVVPEIITANTAPTGSFNAATQKTDGTGLVDISIEVNDADVDDTKAKIEYDTDAACDGSWNDATISGPATADFDDSGGAPDVNNASAYQVGSTATTRIITSSGSNTIQFDWDSATDASGIDATYCLRLTVNDDTADQTTPATQTIAIDNVAPTVTDGNISIAGASGTGGAYKIGDTVTVTWNDSAGGDNNTDTISTRTADLSEFGGGVGITMTDTTACGGSAADSIWEACYTITGSEGIDTTNRNASVTATDDAGNETTTADTTNATVDTIAPTVTAGNISVTGATGTAGAFKNGDTPTLNWLGDTDGEGDAIASATFDGSSLRAGDAALAAADPGTPGTNNWSVGLSGAMDAQDDTGNTITVTVVDNAGNSTGPITSSTSYTVDTIVPSVSVGNISVTGATGTAGAFKNGDTSVYTWDVITEGESDTLVSVTFNGVNFAAADAAVAGALGGGLYTANGSALDSQDDINNNLTVTVVDNGGNQTVTVGTNNYTIDTNVPTVTDGAISSSITVDAGTIGVAEINDIIRTIWDNSAGGDNNVDTFASITADLSIFGGSATQTLYDNATNGDVIGGDGIYTYDLVIVAGDISAINLNGSVTATDNAGNVTTTADTDSNLSVDNIVSGGAVIYPNNISIVINDGEDCTAKNTVDLRLDATGSHEVLIANTSNFEGLSAGDWRPFVTPMEVGWDLEVGDGQRTVYVLFRSSTLNLSNTIPASIIVDSVNNCNGTPVPPTTPSPEPSEPPTPDKPKPPVEGLNKVIVYEHINYEGRSEEFFGDDPNLFDNTILGDTISSIKVLGGAIATLFENTFYGGKSEIFTQSDPDLRDNFIGSDSVSSLTVTLGELSINFGDLIKGSGDTIYYYASDGKRYVFPTIGTYNTWYEDFGDVKTISDSDLGTIPLRGNITYRPGVKMVKLRTVPDVYAVDENNVLRWVTSEEVAVELYGKDWQRLIDDLSDSFFVDYSVGDPINSSDDFNPVEVFEGVPDINFHLGFGEIIKFESTTCTSAAEFTSFLEVGSLGSDVVALQELLQCLGYFPEDIEANGVFGPTTEQAVKDFQTSNGIDSVGYVGPGTRAALNQY